MIQARKSATIAIPTNEGKFNGLRPSACSKGTQVSGQTCGKTIKASGKNNINPPRKAKSKVLGPSASSKLSKESIAGPTMSTTC
eukprot:1137426-Pelagomonas_calceolata.AAC.3